MSRWFVRRCVILSSLAQPPARVVVILFDDFGGIAELVWSDWLLLFFERDWLFELVVFFGRAVFFVDFWEVGSMFSDVACVLMSFWDRNIVEESWASAFRASSF